MNNKIWYLSTCNTCKKIINELELKKIKNFEFQDIKKDNISKFDLDEIHKITKLSYENLFNKRAQKYLKSDLKKTIKSDEDFKKAILSEYTFMKRPIIRIKNKYYIGNSKETIIKAKLNLIN